MRAIAVLCVVGYHAFPGAVPGGFVGVDVFFVISGFLISSIIFDNLEKGSFSFSEFYSRRITRIFPALLVVLVACGLYGWFALLDDEFRQLGKHIAAGAGFVSNLVFWSEAGYFDRAAETKPLLHLWSLGIEEQFYIVWPLLLYLGFRRGISLFRLVLVVAAISFGLNIASLGGAAEATFYSPFTRFWELLAGGLLAYLYGHRSGGGSGPLNSTAPVVASPLMHAQSGLGLALIAVAVLLVTRDSVFPGWWALLPVGGAYLIIAAGPRAWVNRVLLSHPVMVWVGLISYPLYLWHWPLLTFARILEAGTPPLATRVGLVLVAVLLSWLTYRLVEKPIRSGRRAKSTVISLCVMMLAAGLAGYVASQYGNAGKSPRDGTGLPRGPGNASPYPYVDNQFAFVWPRIEDRQKYEERTRQCRALTGVKVRYCLLQDPAVPPTVAFIGDSHAHRIFAAVGAAVAQTGGNLVMLGIDGCPPFVNVENEQRQCPAGIKRITDFVTASPHIHTVLLTARFAAVLSGTNLSPSQPENRSVLSKVDRPEIQDRTTIFQAGLEDMIRLLTAAGKKVIVILENPELDFDPRACLPERGGRSCRMSRKAVEDRQAAYRRVMADVASRYESVDLFDLVPYFCQGDECVAESDGFILYTDSDHLGLNGEAFLLRSRFPADLAGLMN